ncbi:hypothetical protein BJB45_12975 [Halomonas huangheensis]|uniref:Uncharacterized protein n=1 Tax=Halomonas huangheensis TaxID=1178482 RepID=W1N7Q1_9GAMM|nr:hypothetical protein BJB45_12975 [Halomonas huangheensis]
MATCVAGVPSPLHGDELVFPDPQHVLIAEDNHSTVNWCPP